MVAIKRGAPRARTLALSVVAGLALVGLFAGVAAKPATATSITPVFVAGNPSCTSLGYSFGFKVDPPDAGTYSIDGINSVTVTRDGASFDWSSTLGMDAVISKGGSNANVYAYNPEATSDTGLHSPINPSNGQPFGLSHIEFCFDYEVKVTKTAQTSFKRSWQWSIDKSVTPATWNMFKGDSGTSQYTVAVQRTGSTDSDWAVSGQITIQNPAPFQANVTGVSDAITGGINAAVDCGAPLPILIQPGGSLVCSYTSALPNGTDRTNTATVTTTGAAAGGSGSAPVAFGAPTTQVNATIDVNDTNGSSWQFNDSGSVQYTKTFACDGDEGTHDNTATIQQTGQSDSASVTVNCYDLAVSKNASTSKTKTWSWTIAKSADQTQLLLMPGQSFFVNYKIDVSATAQDSNWAVSGTITVQNSAPIAATINSVSDLVSGGISGSVSNCSSPLPATLAAGGTLTCSYTAALPDGADRTNTATATQQNYAYDSSGTGTPSGTTNYSGSAAVSFAQATVTEVDECVNLSDSLKGALGQVCANDAPTSISYSLPLGPYTAEQCGEHSVDNVAAFLTNDSGATGNDGHSVAITVPCPDQGGCTLTQGYWKTHSMHGPAPYDDAWLNIGPLGSDTPFFLSGKTYYQVLWTAPAGNVYYNLAHQWIAAKLNVLNGADDTAIAAALAQAQALLASTTPAQGAAVKGGAKSTWLNLATALDAYNNGVTGPGHCSE